MAIVDGNQYLNDAVADLFCSNLDPSGLYTISYSSDSARDSAYDADASKKHVTDFTYIRKDSILKVPYNADYLDSLGINYCRYQNPQFAGRYIYAFIDSIEYLAPEVSALHIRTDSFTTYQQNIKQQGSQQYIKRRTVTGAEDTIYTNLLEEPIRGTNYRMDAQISGREKITVTGNFFNRYYIGVIFKTCVVSRVEGFLTGVSDPNKAAKNILNDECGHYLNGMPVGGNILVVESYDHLKQVGKMISTLGSEIMATFWIPKTTSDQTQPQTVQPVELSVEKSLVITIEDATIIGDTEPDTFVCYYQVPKDDTWTLNLSPYTPVGSMVKWFGTYRPFNNKCYNYPYNYMVGTDNCGSEIPYRFEYFSDGGTPQFDFRFVTNTNNAIVVRPTNYGGSGDTALDLAIIVEGFPQIPYYSDNYAYYLGTHTAQTSVAKYSRLLDYGIGLFNVIGGGIKAAGVGDEAILSGAEMAKKGASGMLDTALNKSIPAIAESLDKQQQLGYTVNNAASVTTRAAMGYLGATIYHKYLNDHDIKLVDEYFSRYGYAWERLEDLNITRCPTYDYIQVEGCNIEGAIPVADKQRLNALFNAGITIWHKADRYGLYMDDNDDNGHTRLTP